MPVRESMRATRSSSAFIASSRVRLANSRMSRTTTTTPASPQPTNAASETGSIVSNKASTIQAIGTPPAPHEWEA